MNVKRKLLNCIKRAVHTWKMPVNAVHLLGNLSRNNQTKRKETRLALLALQNKIGLLHVTVEFYLV